MNCPDAELLLAAAAVHAVDEGTDLGLLRRHLRDCASCRAAGAGFQRAADLLPLSVELVDPPAQLRSRVLSIVHMEVAGAPATPRLAPWWRRLWDRVPATRGLSLVGALAVVAAAVLVVVLVTGGRQPAAPVASYTVHGCGLTPQPSACASLTVHASTNQGVLTVSGLAPIPTVGGVPTGVYEVWLITAARHPEPAAFLSMLPDGHTWAAAVTIDPSRHVALAMTEEPYPNGSTAPTGAVIFQLNLPAPARTS